MCKLGESCSSLTNRVSKPRGVSRSLSGSRSEGIGVSGVSRRVDPNASVNSPLIPSPTGAAVKLPGTGGSDSAISECSREEGWDAGELDAVVGPDVGCDGGPINFLLRG